MPRKKPAITVVRSTRRKKTVEAKRTTEGFEVRVPANMPEREVQEWIDRMIAKVEAAEEVRRLNGEFDLDGRARRLHQEYFDSRPALGSIRFVNNQRDRYGSCTPSTKTIRVNQVLASFPEWVLDYVIVHELAHLRVADHSRRFWRLVERYPHTERAKGFLIAKGLSE